MPYDEGLAHRIEALLNDQSDISEKKMFGGLCYMCRGHMACGIVGSELMVRVGKDAYADALAQEHAREMDFTGKPLTDMVYVSEEGIAEDADLLAWISRGLANARSLPEKKPKRSISKKRSTKNRSIR